MQRFIYNSDLDLNFVSFQWYTLTFTGSSRNSFITPHKCPSGSSSGIVTKHQARIKTNFNIKCQTERSLPWKRAIQDDNGEAEISREEKQNGKIDPKDIIFLKKREKPFPLPFKKKGDLERPFSTHSLKFQYDVPSKIAETYVSLHVHSNFSLLDGASSISDLVKIAKEQKAPAIAVTDHGVMYGAIQLIKECKKAGIKPIVGNEMYLINGDITKPHNGRKYHLIVLAKNLQGYRNLVKLTTISHIEGWQGSGIFKRPCINKELLKRYKEGLIVSSACLGGEIPQAILAREYDVAKSIASWYKDVFGDDFYLELQDHGYIMDRIVNLGLERLALDLGIKLIATNDSHFTCDDDYTGHDALICIHTGKKKTDQNRLFYSGLEFYKTIDQMRMLFVDHLEPDLVEVALLNTLEIADKVEEYNILGEPRIPNYPLPGNFKGSHAEYLKYQARKGLEEKFRTFEGIYSYDRQEYEERLNYELEMIETMGFSAYFLVVWDYIAYAKNQGIPVGPGRGSAAGSLAAYSLGITNVDPIKYKLLFERFLNPERRSMPDIDTDFSIEGREQVIKYVSEKYTKDHVAQIITFNTLSSRQVLRDVARVLNVSLPEADKLAKLVPLIRNKPAKLSTLITENSPSKEFYEQYVSDRVTREWVDTALSIEGLNKSFGVHAAGVVISADPLYDVVPLSLGKQGERITQYAMEDIEALGLLKMDFLGLKNLTILESAVNFIKERQQVSDASEAAFFANKTITLDSSLIDFNDKKTYELLASKNLDGVFQLDASAGMQQIVRDLKPSSLEDVSSILALYRPGPLNAGLIPKFIARKHGQEEITFEHPLLEPILKETYGIMVYQEQIMTIAQVLAGYTLGQADMLRRAMGKKKKDEMESQRNKFVSGAVANSVPEKTAMHLFDQMVGFAEYCFNKSHSCAYGFVTMHTAYLKANFPIEYAAALLKANASHTDKLPRYIADANKGGVPVLAPSVNFSKLGFSPVYTKTLQKGAYKTSLENKKLPGGVVFGLEAVRGIGEKAALVIIEERERNGLFISIMDMCQRLPSLNKKALESLIRCGAFDSMHQSRKVLEECMPQIQQALRKISTRKEALHKRQEKELEKLRVKNPQLKEDETQAMLSDKFSLENDRIAQDQYESLQLLQHRIDTDLGDYEYKQKLTYEKEFLGFYVSGDPLKYVNQYLKLLAPDPAAGVSGIGVKTIDEDEDEVEEMHLPESEEAGDDEAGDDEHDEDTVFEKKLREFAKFFEGKIHSHSAYLHEDITLIPNQAKMIGIGSIAEKQVINTKKGDKMCKIKIEDGSGTCELIFFPQLYRKVQHFLLENDIIMYVGKVDRGNFTQVIAEWVILIEEGQTFVIDINYNQVTDIVAKRLNVTLKKAYPHNPHLNQFSNGSARWGEHRMQRGLPGDIIPVVIRVGFLEDKEVYTIRLDTKYWVQSSITAFKAFKEDRWTSSLVKAFHENKNETPSQNVGIVQSTGAGVDNNDTGDGIADTEAIEETKYEVQENNHHGRKETKRFPRNEVESLDFDSNENENSFEKNDNSEILVNLVSNEKEKKSSHRKGFESLRKTPGKTENGIDTKSKNITAESFDLKPAFHIGSNEKVRDINSIEMNGNRLGNRTNYEHQGNNDARFINTDSVPTDPNDLSETFSARGESTKPAHYSDELNLNFSQGKKVTVSKLSTGDKNESTLKSEAILSALEKEMPKQFSDERNVSSPSHSDHKMRSSMSEPYSGDVSEDKIEFYDDLEKNFKTSVAKTTSQRGGEIKPSSPVASYKGLPVVSLKSTGKVVTRQHFENGREKNVLDLTEYIFTLENGEKHIVKGPEAQKFVEVLDAINDAQNYTGNAMSEEEKESPDKMNELVDFALISIVSDEKSRRVYENAGVKNLRSYDEKGRLKGGSTFLSKDCTEPTGSDLEE